MAAKKTKIAVGFALLGVLCVVMGFVLSEVILQKLRDGIVEKISIPTNPESDDFKDWATSDRKDAAAMYWSFSFFNLTNPEEVLAGGKAVMNETLPYTYRQYKYNWNYTFEQDKTRIKTIERKRFAVECIPGRTCGDQDDEIVTMYTPYVAALGFAGNNPQNLQAALSGAAIKTFWTLGNAYAATKMQTGKFVACEDGKYKTPVDCMVNQWSNRSMISLYDTPDFIDFVCKGVALKDPVRGPTFCAMVKYVHENPAESVRRPEIGISLNSTGVELSFEQAQNMLFGTTMPDKQVGCGFLQTSTVLGDPSDIPCTAVFLKLMSEGQSPKVNAIWPPLEDLSKKSPAVMFALLSVLLSHGNYMLQTVGLQAGVLSTGTAIKPNDNFVWAKRKPTSWALKFDDPLMAISKPADAPLSAFDTAFFGNKNFSSNEEQEAAGMATWDVYYTGKDHINMAKSYLADTEMFVLPQKADPSDPRSPGAYCGGDVEVHGHDDTQFTPGTNHFLSFGHGVRKFDKPTVWVSAVMRPVELEYVKTVKVHGIEAYRFRPILSPDLVTDSPHYGMFNMTCVKDGVPIIMTLPHQMTTQYDQNCTTSPSCVTKDWWYGGIDRIEDTEENEEKYQVFLDIDPVTGASIRGQLRLQINLAVSAQQGLSGTKIDDGFKLVPLLWIERYSEMTAKQASEYKDKIWFALRLQKGLLFGLTIGGGLLALFCIGVVCISSRSKTSSPSLQYETMYEESLLAPELSSTV